MATKAVVAGLVLALALPEPAAEACRVDAPVLRTGHVFVRMQRLRAPGRSRRAVRNRFRNLAQTQVHECYHQYLARTSDRYVSHEPDPHALELVVRGRSWIRGDPQVTVKTSAPGWSDEDTVCMRSALSYVDAEARFTLVVWWQPYVTIRFGP